MTLQFKLIAFWVMLCCVGAFLWFWHYAKMSELDKLQKEKVQKVHSEKLIQKDTIIEIGKYDTNKSTFEVEHKLIDKQIMKEIRNDEVNLSRGVHTWRSK